jgi:hypothetical protein
MKDKRFVDVWFDDESSKWTVSICNEDGEEYRRIGHGVSKDDAQEIAITNGIARMMDVRLHSVASGISDLKVIHKAD